MSKTKTINLNPSHFQYVELSDASDKPFDGFAPGVDFVDMAGHVITIAPEDVPTYLANTQKAIESTRGESGELAGLPIDAKGHDKGDGAGYILDAQPDGNKIKLTPSWNDIGRDVIGKKIRRWFSATVDTVNKVILGGSLTNWPATRKKNGEILLRPIELSSPLIALQEGESLDDQSMNVRRAFGAAFMQPMDSPYCDEVFADHVIVKSGDKKFKVAYSADESGAIAFAPFAEWVEVVETYVEASANKQQQGVIEMTKEEVEAMIAPLMAKIAEFSKPAAPIASPAASPTLLDLSQMINLEGLSDEAKAKQMQAIEAAVSQMQQATELQYAQVFAKRQRESNIANLSAQLVGGTPDAPRGLRGTDAAELSKRLAKLDPDDEKYFSDLLINLQVNGFVNYKELGHNRKASGTLALPAEYAKKLDNQELTISDRSNPIAASDLGDLTQYDLSRWAGKESK